MTLTKQALSDALAYETDGRWTSQRPSFLVAARFVERLLPEKCEPCGGSGEDGFDRQGSHAEDRYVGYVHEACHGTGQLWDEGLEEVVAATLADNLNEFVDRKARAVLAALAEEVGK